MEDDNALDIIKWLFKETTNVDIKGILTRDFDGGKSKWESAFRGNLLAMKPMDVAAVPQLFVCEKVQVYKDAADPSSFFLKYGEEELRVSAGSEAEADKWLLKLSICSHQMIQAELDQIMQTYYAETTCSSPTTAQKLDNGSLSGYFLTAPFEKEKSFYIYQSVGIPNRVVLCKELMCESKMSLVIPPDMLKLSVGWASQLRDDLLTWLSSVRNVAILSSLQNAVCHLNSNIEILTQGIEFLDSYAGPCFRPSAQRYRMAFSAVPTNLHVQYFQINSQPTAYFLTCGATTAAPLRFAAGGLYKMRNKLVSGLEPHALDATNEYRFHVRRKTLLNVKREIGDMTKRIDCDWHVANFGTVDKVGVEIFSQLKQLHETVCDIIQSFPNISNLVDGLCANGHMQLPATNAIPDTLANQLDCLDASMISLNSKMAVIDIVDDPKGRDTFEESAKSALNSTLDMLLQVVESVLIAQLVSLVISLRRPADSQLFFNIQLRSDLLLSQAVAIITTALLTSLHDFLEKETPNYQKLSSVTMPFVSCFSLLSCYGDERAMMEDMFEIWSSFYNHVQFRYVEANSTVSQTCIPQIEGSRTDLRISIPLAPEFYKKLVNTLKVEEVAWFRVETIFWNIGVNHEATLAFSLGDASLEENVNKTALHRLQNYVQRYCDKVQTFANDKADTTANADAAEDAQTSSSAHTNASGTTSDSLKDHTKSICALFSELKETVNACPSKKNMNIFYKIMDLTNMLNGISIISCKSGKDRTAMAVTLQEGRVLKETCGISQDQMTEIVDCLRLDGVRRENCRKNVNKAIYSFSPSQMYFLPKELRPPNGTYASRVSS